MNMNSFFSNSNDVDLMNTQVINNGISYGYKIVEPNFCPFENKPTLFRHIINTQMDTYHLKATRRLGQKSSIKHFGAIFRCHSCHRYCLLDYNAPDSTPAENAQAYLNNNYHNNRDNLKLLFSNDDLAKLESISPNFTDTYIESAKAEHNHYKKIDAMGYRRALEFLIKGYVKNFEKRDLKPTLNKNIDLLDMPDMMDSARLAAWIGNDGTHTKNEDPTLNIQDLKNCLSAVGHFIIYKIIARHAYKYISKKSPKYRRKK